MGITAADNCNFTASAFSENTVNPFSDLISVILGFQSVKEHNLVIYKAIQERVTTKNRILSTKDTRRLKVSILVVFRMGCLFYFQFLMVQDVLRNSYHFCYSFNVKQLSKICAIFIYSIIRTHTY